MNAKNVSSEGLSFSRGTTAAIDRRSCSADGNRPYALHWKEVGISVLVSSVIGVWLALSFGLDTNWDLRNYHFYSVYALFNNRYDIDIAPGQRQTWFNPSPEVLDYFLVRYVDPYIATAIMGAVGALNLPAIYILSRLSISNEMSVLASRLISAGLAITALFTPMFYSELGTTFTDANTALFVLLALIIVLRFEFSDKSILVAGLLVGFSVGFKLTGAIFAVAFFCAVLVSCRGNKLKSVLILSSALALGYIPFGATWNMFLWIKFKNPFFPVYNDYFHSAEYLPVSLVDDRFIPRSLEQIINLPGKWASGQAVTSELSFRDFRFFLLGVLVIFFSPVLLARAKNAKLIFRGNAILFLSIFFVISFLLWLKLFGIQRYMLILELTSALLILAIFDRIILEMKAKFWTFLIAFVFVLLTTSCPDWGHMPLGHRWLQADFPADQKSHEVLHIMLGDDGMSYVIVSAPENHSFIFIEGNLQAFAKSGLGERARERIASYQGEIRSLSIAVPSQKNDESLKIYGLEFVPGTCEPITTRIEIFQSCLLRKS